ncbi:hypothetical protein EV361DRAFT_441268 [Lentinula raphanica]|nr:hypothetical protein EV361DRAFT_441268 [Lentinula raphanica]
MGRALYSRSHAPVIRDPSPPEYEKWSINNPFDPDSEEFCKGAQYEAFLEEPVESGRTIDLAAVYSPPLATRLVFPAEEIPRTTRVRISSDGPSSNSRIFDSVPRDLPDMDAPTLPILPPPVSMFDFVEDMDAMRPTPSPMAADSDPEDPIRIIANFMNEYRSSQNQTDAGNIDVAEFLRQLDERWREIREAQAVATRRFLPPLSYPSSDASSASSRAGSPPSPILFPYPPSERIPVPPAMSRVSATLPDPSSYDTTFEFDDESVRHELRPVALEALAESVRRPVASVVSIPISESRSPPRPVRIRHRAASSFGNEVGFDMSPPPSVSPRLYNWARTRSESHSRHDSSASSSGSFGRHVHDELHAGRGISIPQRRF